MTRFIDKWRERFGVEFVCRTIGVPVSTYYARKTRQPSLRALQDRELVRAIHEARVCPHDRQAVVAYTGGTPPYPWTVYVADTICDELEHAIRALSGEQAAD